MFFYASKILGFFTQPSNFIAALCVVGLALVLMNRHRLGTWLVTSGILLLLLFGYSPLANVMLLPLTERFPKWQDDGRAPDGVIVLGGAIDSDSSTARGSLEMNASGERITAMLELAHRYPQARIVFTGGASSLIEQSLSEAPVAGDVLRRFGVASERVLLETDSRTTDENASFTARMVHPKPGERWLLVTSAWHMPRSIGAFRKAGFDVEAYPVDWRTRGWIDAGETFDAASHGLARSDVAMHEWVGLISYRLAGRSSEWLPGPKR
ncbi:YdcF family protein [Tardiphaga alba]|uniref:YdcF family protein n=1 Tax=Tardiphaga alba TaxID=340268 RepID=A0ABX8A767_9BRAD|nr:YdcF family protein [Tardiphaga alba]QUS39493.1 YdcF family protein [Tardiphaga alba]